MDGTSALRLGPGELRGIDQDIAAWESELRRKRRSRDYLTRGPAVIRELTARFGWTSSAQATPAQISLWLADEGGSGHTQNNRVSMIRAYFHHCQKTLRTVTSNPAADIERADSSRGEGVREFTAGEMAALFQAATGHWRTAVGLMATTALRRGAVFRGVRCGWMDREHRTLVIPAGILKNRKSQSIPLNEDAMLVLEAATRGRAADEFIVPIKPDHRAWSRLVRAAGISRRDTRGRPCGMHSFRKGVLTNLAELGVHPKVAQDLAGHSDIRLTMGVYTQMNTRAQADALKKLPRLSAGIVRSCADHLTKSDGKAVDKTGDDADCVGGDPEGNAMVCSTAQPGQNARPSALPSVDHQSPQDSAHLGRAFRSGSCENPECSEALGDSGFLTHGHVGGRGFEPRTPPGTSDPTRLDRAGFQPSTTQTGPGAGSIPQVGHAIPRQPERKTGDPDFVSPVGASAEAPNTGGDAKLVRARTWGHTLKGEAGPQTGSPTDCAVEQQLAHRSHTPEVEGASPSRAIPTTPLVERRLAVITDLIAAQRELVALARAITTHGATRDERHE